MIKGFVGRPLELRQVAYAEARNVGSIATDLRGDRATISNFGVTVQ
jgi:hypothetical protein